MFIMESNFNKMCNFNFIKGSFIFICERKQTISILLKYFFY